MSRAIDDDAIRQRAYAIWESEGRPHGRDAQHWDIARRELEAALAPAAAPPAAKKPAARKPVPGGGTTVPPQAGPGRRKPKPAVPPGP